MTFRVFGPAGRGAFPSTTRFVARLFDPDGIYAYQRTFGAEEHFAVMDLPIDLAAPAREILREGDLRIRSVATNHGEAPSVAYRIDGPGWSIAFSGDLDPSGLPNLTRLATASICSSSTVPSSILPALRGSSTRATPLPGRSGKWHGRPERGGLCSPTSRRTWTRPPARCWRRWARPTRARWTWPRTGCESPSELPEAPRHDSAPALTPSLRAPAIHSDLRILTRPGIGSSQAKSIWRAPSQE